MREISANQKDPHRYDDLLDYPYEGSKNRKHMPLSERAAQFSPFAALTGYSEQIAETARLTDVFSEQSEEEIQQTDRALRILYEHRMDKPEVALLVFAFDEKKDGGMQKLVSGKISRIDPVQQYIEIHGERFDFAQILHAEAELLKTEFFE